MCTVAMGIIAVAAVSTLTGCAGSITGSSTAMQGPQLQKLSITGALSYRARIALPPKARAIVELREGSTDDGPVIDVPTGCTDIVPSLASPGVKFAGSLTDPGSCSPIPRDIVGGFEGQMRTLCCAEGF